MLPKGQDVDLAYRHLGLLDYSMRETIGLLRLIMRPGGCSADCRGSGDLLQIGPATYCRVQQAASFLGASLDAANSGSSAVSSGASSVSGACHAADSMVHLSIQYGNQDTWMATLVPPHI